MRTFAATFSLLFLVSVSALTQDAQVAPKPTPPDARDVVRISTNLIQLDVTVTDKKGKVITDLRPDEIEIFENGKKQDISNFSFISNLTRKAEQPVKKDRNLPAAPEVNSEAKPENVRRTIAIVIDDLTLSFTSAYWVKSALKKFVKEQVQDGDLVGIVRTGGGVGILQQLTTNKRQLMAAVENSRFNLSGSGKIGTVNAIRPWVSAGETQGEGFRDDMMVNASLTSMYQIIDGIRDLPGRKSVVLLTDGFVLFPRSRNGLSSPSGSARNAILNSVRRLTDLANRSSVVIYTIEAKGLIAPGLMGEDNTFDMGSDQVSAMVAGRDKEVWDGQEGPAYLSRETGGFSIVNSNAINKGIDKILDDQSYYLIGYQPDEETFDPKRNRYNSLEIKVKRPDAKVRYRSGFFGVDSREMAKPTLTATESIIKALTSPFAVNDIPLHLNAFFVAGEKNSLNVKSYLHINAGDLTFTKEADGTYLADFDIVGVAFGNRGTSIDEFAKRYKIKLQESAYQRVQKKGFVYNFAFPVKNPGGYQVRVAIYDSVTKKVGSAGQFIEIPKLHSDRLTLSGLIFETVPLNIWQKAIVESKQVAYDADPHLDTSLRRFTAGSLVRFGYSIYRGKDKLGKPLKLIQQFRVFYEDKVIFESQPAVIPSDGIETITAMGSFELGKDMLPGDYIIQVIVTDELSKGSKKMSTQATQFELVGQ